MESPGKIFLADQRSWEENQTLRRHRTFNGGDWHREHKDPEGRLQVFNEEFLAAAQHTTVASGEDTFVLLLPVTGEVSCRAAGAAVLDAAPEQLVLMAVPPHQVIEFSNPYPSDWINYIYVLIRAGKPVGHFSRLLLSFDFSAHPDELICLLAADENQDPGFSVYTGLFGGRKEAVFTTGSQSSTVFISVLSGAFEVQGRLLHAKDSLSLWDCTLIEIEALSAHAIILLIELQAPAGRSISICGMPSSR